MNKNYVPQPVDTSDIQLPEELSELVEQMAKNVHEVWAQSRMEQGWTWGEERSDALKQHPCLVAYEDLPEIEKAFKKIHNKTDVLITADHGHTDTDNLFLEDYPDVAKCLSLQTWLTTHMAFWKKDT